MDGFRQKGRAKMEIVALVISILAFIVGAVAYMRSGGREDIRTMEKTFKRKIEELTALAQETKEQMRAYVTAGYERSIRAISAMQAQLEGLKKEAMAEVRSDIAALEQMLRMLSEQARRELEEVRSTAGQIRVEAEEEMRRTVEEAKARLEVLDAKKELALARFALASDDLIHAQSHLASALSSLKNARSLSGRFTEGIMAVQHQTQSLLKETRMHSKILEALIERNDRLLAEMSSDTGEAPTMKEKAARATTGR
jgi:polyhydroxyalkanoate synthesis regulator phasin